MQKERERETRRERERKRERERNQFILSDVNDRVDMNIFPLRHCPRGHDWFDFSQNVALTPDIALRS